MFVYIHVPQIIPSARAPGSGPKLSLFSEVSYDSVFLDVTHFYQINSINSEIWDPQIVLPQ